MTAPFADRDRSSSDQSPLHVFSPTSARTADRVAVLWDCPAAAADRYDVIANGVLSGTTKQKHFVVNGLAPAREYELVVRALSAGGKVVSEGSTRVRTKSVPTVIDVTAHGAIGDGQTLNTAALQAAIEACPPGGVVCVPAGRFLSGAIFLKSEMTLLLSDDAVLFGSDDLADYPRMTYRYEGIEKIGYASLINTRDAAGQRLRDITIAGRGKIDARGSVLRHKQIAAGGGAPGRAICLRDVDGIFLIDFTVRNSPAWCVHLIYCSDIAATGLQIHTRVDEAGNKYAVPNCDGFNPDSSQNVYIFGCHIASQDDCIAIKSGRDAEGRNLARASENIRITDCHFASGFGVAVGSEMSGGVRNVLVEDCTFNDTFSIAALKAPRGRGGVIENITFRNCSQINRNTDHHDCRWFRGAIYVDQFYTQETFDPHQAEPVSDGTAVIRNVLFENITLDTVGGNAIYLTGLVERPLENIRLENVTAIGKHGLIANNIRGLTLNQVSVEAREGKAMRVVNVQ